MNRYSSVHIAGLAAALIAGATRPIEAQAIQGARAVVPSAPAASDTITFEEAIAIALRQNTAVRQARNAESLSETSVKQQRMQFLPDLRLSTSTGESYGRSFSESEGRIVDRTTRSLNAGVSSSVTLFDGFGNVAALRAAQAGEDASEQELARVRQTAAFTVASNFVSLVAGAERLRVQEENLAAQRTQEEQIQRYVDAGARPISDLYQQQAAVASARVAVVEGRRALELAKLDLMQTLQLDPARTYVFATPTLPDTAAAVTYDLPSLLASAYANRADLEAEESRVDAARQSVKQAASSLWPTISVSAGYNTAFSDATDVAFADQLDQRRGGSLSLGVSIPLFDRGSTSLETQRAKIQEDNARLALQAQRQTVALEVRRAFLDYESAREQLAAAEAQRRAAAQALDASRQRYEAGAATLVELTQARAARTEAESALVNARYTLLFQQALMSYYTGELDPARLTLG